MYAASFPVQSDSWFSFLLLSIEYKYQVGFGSENTASDGTANMKHKHHQNKVNPSAFVSAYQFLSSYFKDNFEKNTKVEE